MAFTEIVVPSLKQDAETREIFIATTSDLLEPILSAHGNLHTSLGHMVSENNISVGDDFRIVLGLEWTSKQDFDTFLASDTFKAFGASIAPFVANSPTPQLFETDQSPVSVFLAPLTEVFRIKTQDGSRSCLESWKEFVDAVGMHSVGGKPHGMSAYPTDDIFVGIIGWENLELRESAYANTQVAGARKALEGLADLTTFVVRFSHLGQK